MAQSIDDIRNSRDAALAALDASISAVGNQIAQTTTMGPYLAQLTTRYHDLMTQRNAILVATTDSVLSLPSVIAAAATLTGLANQMKTVAQALPTATNVLTGSASVLSSAQQFADTLALTGTHGTGGGPNG
jgi:hypothetical protein